MKRKLINLESFSQIEKGSLSKAEHELTEAAGHLGRTLGTGPLSFRFFNESLAVYETERGTYVQAGYAVKPEAVVLENITELVIDKDSFRSKLREHVAALVDGVIDNDKAAAMRGFRDYVESYVRYSRGQRSLAEGKKAAACKKGCEKMPWGKQGWKKTPQHVVKAGWKKLKEWATVARNVAGYMEFMESGTVDSQTEVVRNAAGDVTGVTLPSSRLRNEAKLIQMTFKTLMSTELKELREWAHRLGADEHFVKSVGELKRLKNMGLDQEFDGKLGKVVTGHPSVLCLTPDELAESVRTALENAGDGNYDDDLCAFLAEGILRTAHDAYAARVETIAKLAGVKAAEKGVTFEQFAEIGASFFPTLDESSTRELQMFSDLYESLLEVRRFAAECGNDHVRGEAAEHLAELHGVLHGRNSASLDLASKSADLLGTIVESSKVASKSNTGWDVSNDAHLTQNGDHPALFSKAKASGNPADGDHWDSPGGMALTDDGGMPTAKSSKDLGLKAWSNKGNWKIDNPYLPKAVIPTLKGEPGVDKNWGDGFAMIQNKDTWPNLQNPNNKPSEPVYKMKSDNLVVDK